MVSAVAYASAIILMIQMTIYAEEYTFDAAAFTKKTLEYSGTIEARASTALAQKQSIAGRLKYYDSAHPPDLLDTYVMIATPSVLYEKGKLALHASAEARVYYNYPQHEYGTGIALLDGYALYEGSTHWSILAGKKRYKWGSGYIYNPVAYVSRPKDVHNVDAAQEGYYAATLRYNRSVAWGGIKNYAHEIVYIPVTDALNKGYAGSSRSWLLNHAYVLVFNADVDLFFNVTPRLDFTTGVSAAYNLLANWEVHGECSYLPQTFKTVMGAGAVPQQVVRRDVVQAVAGTRYLAPFEATFYAEYLYNGEGLNVQEMERWYDAALGSIAQGDTMQLSRMRASWMRHVGTQFLMQHYLYFKVQYPEPFNLLYITPSVYIVMNIVDTSFLTGIDVAYKRFDTFSLNLKLVGMGGVTPAEYASKVSRGSIDIGVKYYF